MTMTRPLCTVAEIISDLKIQGDDTTLLGRIEQASQFIERKFGNFIPLTEKRTVDGRGTRTLFTDPLLSVTSLLEDGSALQPAAYLLYSLKGNNPLWSNGPYTRIKHENESSWLHDQANIEITGHWGMYEETEDLGITASQTDVVKTITVTDGSILSPGMVLLIESESELVTAPYSPTALVSLVNGAVDAVTQEITIDNGAEVNPGEVICIAHEDMRILRVAGNVLLVDRQWNNTPAEAHVDDSSISVYRTYSVKRGVNGTTAAAHTNKSVLRYVVPSDINGLARKIACLKVKIAETQFSGKAGSNEMGEAFYYKEYPSEIEDIRSNYRIIGV